MEKITMKDFEELISKDEALTAKAKEITGEGEKKKRLQLLPHPWAMSLFPTV
jgi:hypothetical protein